MPTVCGRMSSSTTPRSGSPSSSTAPSTNASVDSCVERMDRIPSRFASSSSWFRDSTARSRTTTSTEPLTRRTCRPSAVGSFESGGRVPTSSVRPSGSSSTSDSGTSIDNEIGACAIRGASTEFRLSFWGQLSDDWVWVTGRKGSATKHRKPMMPAAMAASRTPLVGFGPSIGGRSIRSTVTTGSSGSGLRLISLVSADTEPQFTEKAPIA